MAAARVAQAVDSATRDYRRCVRHAYAWVRHARARMGGRSAQLCVRAWAQVNVEQPICKDFNNGLCTRGAGCRYKHAQEPPGYRVDAQQPAQRNPYGGQTPAQQQAAYAAYSSYYAASGYGGGGYAYNPYGQQGGYGGQGGYGYGGGY